MLLITVIFSFLIISWTTGNIYIGALGFLVFVIIYVIVNIFKKQKINYLQIIIYVGLAILSVLSVWYYNYNHKYIYPENGINNTGTVVAITGPDKYIIEINNQKRIAKVPNKDYHIGDIIKVIGKIQMRSNYPSNIYNLSKFDNKSYLLGGEFDYARWMYMKGYAGQISILASDVIGREPGFWGWIYDIRDILSVSTKAGFSNHNTKGLVLGLLVGDRSIIDNDTNKDFINSGLVHILAVSGGNIAMLVSFLMLILFWLPYYARISAISIMVIIYGMICGGDSSVIRAVIMASIGIIGLFAGRDINIWRVLTITYICMLVANPYILAYDMGFGLSFGAIVGLVLFDIREYLVSKWLYPVKEWIAPSIGANLGVLPIIILASGKLNIYGIFANFLVLPILPVVLLCSVGILGFGRMGLLGNIHMKYFIYIIDSLTGWIFVVNNWVSSNGIYLHFEVIWVRYILVSICILGWIVIYEYLQKKKVEDNGK